MPDNRGSSSTYTHGTPEWAAVEALLHNDNPYLGTQFPRGRSSEIAEWAVEIVLDAIGFDALVAERDRLAETVTWYEQMSPAEVEANARLIVENNRLWELLNEWLGVPLTLEDHMKIEADCNGLQRRTIEAVDAKLPQKEGSDEHG